MKMCVRPLLVTTTLKVVLLFVGRALESAHGRLSHHLCQAALAPLIALSLIDLGSRMTL